MTAKELVLAFGPGEQWLLPADYVTTFIDRPPVSPDLDLADEVARALESPLDFPSLHQAIVPGDVTALLLDPELPNIAELAREVVRWICEHGVSPDSLRLVISNELDAKRIQDTIHSLVGSSIPLIVHDSNDPGMLAYVAANEQADPIYFNREIVDADVIVPIISARSHGQLDFAGLFSVFPLFSNLETQQRFSNYQSLVQVERREQLEQWADQAAWWLGICVAVEVIPGCQGTVSKIIAGTLDALRGKVEQEMQSIWQVELPTCDLLIAGIDGQQQMQTWQNVARILHNAQSCVCPGGSIVICSTLSSRPGKALNRLRDTHHSPEALARFLDAEKSADAVAAASIHQALQDNHVYLVSCLPRNVIEDLGMGAIESLNQLTNLMHQSKACTVLGSAQYRTSQKALTRLR